MWGRRWANIVSNVKKKEEYVTYNCGLVKKSKVPRLSDFSCICAAHPIGASGILLSSNGPLRCAYADTFGVVFDYRRRLRVISVCSSNLSHKFAGKSSATPARTLRKCVLKLRIATSAAFCQ